MVDIQISNIKVTNQLRVKNLIIHTDSRLNFDYHVSQLSEKASKTLHALARIFDYEETAKRRVVVRSLITSQFSFCPLTWIFHSRRMERRINNIHETVLHLIYRSDSKLRFKEE